jgi:hypothetical protein
VSPLWYELGFYIQEDGILHSHRSENFKYDMINLDVRKLELSNAKQYLMTSDER